MWGLILRQLVASVYSSGHAISHSRPDPGWNVNVDARAIGLQDELVQTFLSSVLGILGPVGYTRRGEGEVEGIASLGCHTGLRAKLRLRYF